MFSYIHDRLNRRVFNDLRFRDRLMRKGAKQQRAKALRRAMTDAEQKLWRYLRDRRALGWKFRRQHPIGPFIVDFVCLEAGLIVEADGGQHAEQCRDASRDRYLQCYGFCVLRFWNHEILGDTYAVCDRILLALRQRIQQSSTSRVDPAALSFDSFEAALPPNDCLLPGRETTYGGLPVECAASQAGAQA